MDFHSLSRRELQALCKSKGIRANMSNAAMAEALQCLPSVDGTGEIRSTAPPPPPPPPMSVMKEVPIVEEQAHGSLLPRGGRARAKTRMVAACNTEEDVPDQATLTLQGCQRTGARTAAVVPEAEEAIVEEQEHGCPLPRGGRARGKTRKAGARKTEEEVAPAEEAAVAPEAEEAISEEQEHGCPLPRGGRVRGKTRKAGAQKTVEEEVAPAPHTLLGNKRTMAEEPATPGDAEEVAVGMRTRRLGRSKVKIAPDEKEEDVQAAVRKEQNVSDKSCHDSEEHAVVVAVEEDIIKPQDGQNVTRRAAAAHEDLQQDQRTVEVVATAKKRTTRSTRSKVAAAAQKGQKDDSSNTTVGPEVVPKVEEATKPQEGKNVTSRATVYKEQEEVQTGQVTAAPEAMAAVETEEVARAKRRTRRPTRSNVAAAAQKGQKADSSNATIGPEVDPKDDEVVPKVDEATKPHEGNNVTRRATVYKEQEEVQTGQVTAAPEAMAAVEAEEVATAKRRRRRSARSKVRVAARKSKKADSSDAANGPTVSDDPKEQQLVEVVEEGPTKPNKEEREQISNVCQAASLPKLEDSPILGVVSKPNASDASDKAPVADKMPIKEDGFTFTSEADLSNLLVNTLDRLAKPMYESEDKQEKKGSECWWMLL